MTHGYTVAERKAAAVGAQQTPHTLAAAIVQLEYRRKLVAAKAASAGDTAAAAITAVVLGAAITVSNAAEAAAAASGATVAFRSAAALSASTPAGLVPQPLLGRGVAGLSEEVRARVRAAAAAAAAKEGASPEEVVRAAMHSIIGHVPTHVDAPPPRALQPPLDYGDGL